MSAQDKTEQVLREIHILFSQSEIYDRNRVIVDKQEVLGLLQQLNLCIYEMMEEREITQQSRDAAEREFRRKAEEMIEDAGHTAEDVYAGSVMYTDEALRRVEDIIQEAAENMKQLCFKMAADLQKEKAAVHRDQSELKSHLEDLHDTNKYLKLIEERNREIKKEKEKAERAKQKSGRRRAEKDPAEEAGREEEEAAGAGPENGQEEQPLCAGVRTEIRVNAEYFEKAGLPLPEEEAPEPETEPEQQEQRAAEEEREEEVQKPVPVEVRVNLDADYFKWKEENEKAQAPEKKTEKRSFFGRKMKD